MNVRKVRASAMPALVASLGVLAAPLMLMPSALSSHTEPDYQLLIAFQPEWMKREGLGRQPVTPFNPREGRFDGDIGAG